MSGSQGNGDNLNSVNEADFTKAFEELARGEQTAAALENHLSSLESKIEELLARAAEDEKALRDKPSAEEAKPKKEDGDKNGGNAAA